MSAPPAAPAPDILSAEFAADPYDCAEAADALVIVTEWDAFRALDLARIRTLMRSPVLVDLRNIYRSDDVTLRGFSYVGIGRAPIEHGHGHALRSATAQAKMMSAAVS